MEYQRHPFPDHDPEEATSVDRFTYQDNIFQNMFDYFWVLTVSKRDSLSCDGSNEVNDESRGEGKRGDCMSPELNTAVACDAASGRIGMCATSLSPLKYLI